MAPSPAAPSPAPPPPRPLFAAAQIAARVEELAEEIIADPAFAALRSDPGPVGERVLVVSALTGAFVFTADLMRALNRRGLDTDLAFVQLASYGAGQVSSGAVTLVRDLEVAVAGRVVLFVDDILDSGRTLRYAIDHLLARGARLVRTAVLLNKSVPRAVSVEADFVGFACPDLFVVGYGMDAAGQLRGLPYVGVLEPQSTAPDLP